VGVRLVSQLLDFRARLVGVTGSAFLTQRNALIGQQLEALALREFQASTDPYGAAWKPVGRMSKRLRRGFSGPRRAGKPLIKTGALRRSHVSSASATGVRIGFADPVAVFHQKGTATIPKRQILPEADTGGLPPAWRATIAKTVAGAARAQILGSR
jgi:phage gpG-like protein